MTWSTVPTARNSAQVVFVSWTGPEHFDMEKCFCPPEGAARCVEEPKSCTSMQRTAALPSEACLASRLMGRPVQRELPVAALQLPRQAACAWSMSFEAPQQWNTLGKWLRAVSEQRLYSRVRPWPRSYVPRQAAERVTSILQLQRLKERGAAALDATV